MFNHTHLGVTLASNFRWDDHLERLGGKVAGYVHLCRILAFRHNMHGMAMRRCFVAFIRPRLEYCSAVWCGASPALLMDQEKVHLRVARAIVRNPTLQDVSTLQQARLPTLSWRRREHCLGLLWQLYTGKVPPALQASLVPCAHAQLRSTRFPHFFSFSFCLIVSSLVVLSLSKCPHLQQVAIFCHLFHVSLFSSVSGSTLLYLGYVQLWSLKVLFSHSFRRLPHFYLYVCVDVPTTVFVPCFLLLFHDYFFFACVGVLFERENP